MDNNQDKERFIFGELIYLKHIDMKKIFVACLFACCSREQAAIQTQFVDLQLGETKNVNYSTGELIVNKIKFDRVLDGRCPREQCALCYGGYVYTYFLVQTNRSSSFDTLKLQRISCIPAGDLAINDPNMHTQMVRGLTLGLVNITELTEQSMPKTYAAKIAFIR